MAIAVDVHAGDETEFMAIAEAQGLRIRYVIGIHIHADHVPGGRRLAEMVGVEYALHESNAGLPFDFPPLSDGGSMSAMSLLG